MMDIKEGKKIFSNIIQLEKDLEQYEMEVLLKEKNLEKLKEELEVAELEYDKLENSGLKKMILGVIGKKEEYIQKVTNELRRIKAEVANEEFFVTSSQNQIQQTKEKLEELESVLSEYTSMYVLTNGEDNVIQSFHKARKLPMLRKQIAEISVELRDYFAFADKVHLYGDVHGDLSGKRYNRSDATMRETAGKIKRAIPKLIKLLDEYNNVVPNELVIEFYEEWMEDEKYWEGQQLEEDSYARIKKVDDWFFRFQSLWKKMEKQQNELLDQLRNEVFELENI